MTCSSQAGGAWRWWPRARWTDSEHAGSSAVHPSFTAVLEGKPATLIDNSMFLCNVAVKQHKSEQLVNLFPPANREGTMQTKGDVKAQLERAGSSGYSFVDLLADFHLVLFLDADAFFDKPFVSEGRTHTAGHLRVPAVVGRPAPEGPAEDEIRR